MVATYCNTHHTTTSRTPENCFQLDTKNASVISYLYVCTPQCVEKSVELQVGDHQPRCFAANDDMIVCDLCPNATNPRYSCQSLGSMKFW